MISNKMLTVLLIVMTTALFYQSFVLAGLNSQLKNSNISLGGGGSSAAVVDFNPSTSELPDMVGGC